MRPVGARVVVWGKPDCSLCDDVKEMLAEVARLEPVHVETRNILDNKDDFERYRYLIPVVQIDDGPLIYPPHDLWTLTSAVRVANDQRVIGDAAPQDGYA